MMDSIEEMSGTTDNNLDFSQSSKNFSTQPREPRKPKAAISSASSFQPKDFSPVDSLHPDNPGPPVMSLSQPEIHALKQLLSQH